MSKRKIVKLGPSTLVVSLPAKWTRQFKLEAGDEIELKEQDKNLLVSTQKEFEVEKAALDITNLKPLINYSLLGLYLRGVDEVMVESKKPELLESLQEKPISQLVGWEIIEQNKNHCLVKNVSGMEQVDYKTIFRRIFLIIKTMIDDIEKAVEKGQTDLSHIAAVDKNVGRFSYLCARRLNKFGYDDFKKTPVMYYLVIMLEATSDLYRDFADYISEKKVKFSKKTIQLLKKVNSFFNTYQKLFFQFDQKQATEMDAQYRKTRKEIDSYLNSTRDIHEIRSLFFIIQIADFVSEMMRNYLAIA